MRPCRVRFVAWVGLLLVAGVAVRAIAQDLPGAPTPGDADTQEGSPPEERTPPRLSHTDGEVSFWRQGAEDWTQARVNTPLAPGDQLYVGNAANLELQIGARDFLRVASNSQLALDNDEVDYQQFRLTSGQASVDLRGARTGQTVEVDTPNGAFTIDHSGYYRVEVDDDATHFIVRRGGRATVTPESGDPEDVSPSEEVVVKGNDVESYAAAEPDAWDRWNYDRSDQLVEAVSYRHVPEDVYGVDDLDHDGRWRAVPQYGSVWFPSSVATGWAPYTAGRWILDPYYGWTWIDDAPWGWAPFHYGRWVSIDGFWGWAPGPVVARSYYAPALVAFFAAGPLSAGVGLGTPLLGWTPLGWGEPCRPWWGPASFVGRPRWFGWGGPRVAIHQTVVNDINIYQNARVQGGVVVVNRNEFGRAPVPQSRIAQARLGSLSPVGGALPVRPDPVRVVGGAPRGPRPPQALLDRRVVATRTAAAPPSGGLLPGFGRRPGGPATPQPALVPSPHDARARGSLPRPPFGEQAGVERPAPPPLPRFEDVRRRDAADRQQEASVGAPGSPRDPTATANGGGAPPSPRPPAPAPPAAPPSPSSHPGVARDGSPPGAGAVRSASHATWANLPPPPGRPPMPPQQQQHAPPPVQPRALPELPGQPANRVWAGRPNAVPQAMQQQHPAVPLQRAPQQHAQPGGRNPPPAAAQAGGGASADANARGRGQGGR